LPWVQWPLLLSPVEIPVNFEVYNLTYGSIFHHSAYYIDPSTPRYAQRHRDLLSNLLSRDGPTVHLTFFCSFPLLLELDILPAQKKHLFCFPVLSFLLPMFRPKDHYNIVIDRALLPHSKASHVPFYNMSYLLPLHAYSPWIPVSGYVPIGNAPA